MSTSDKESIVQIMKEASNFSFFATCDGGQPRVRPVAAMVEDDMSVWIATSAASRKVEQIKTNPRVSLAFVQQPQGEKAATIIGEAEIVEDMEQKKRVWGLASYDPSQFWPDGPETKDYCVLKINIKKVEWWEDMAVGMKTYEP
ncbi:MAG: pyridoxamine 5'-phosphate oxidase family protein [Candidatus Zixiibacteriota bacterium]